MPYHIRTSQSTAAGLEYEAYEVEFGVESYRQMSAGGTDISFVEGDIHRPFIIVKNVVLLNLEGAYVDHLPELRLPVHEGPYTIEWIHRTGDRG